MKLLTSLKTGLILCGITLLLSCDKKDDILQVESLTDDYKATVKTANAFGTANEEYGKLGPYKVSTTAVRQDCRGFIGSIQNILASLRVINPDVQCSPSFPYGFQDRRVTEVHYPSNIQSLEKLPVVNFVGGLTSNQGNYDALIKLWVSYGFIVVSTNNFINFSPSMHLYGISGIAALNKDVESPLYNKVDLSKILLSGHSAGGGGALITSSFPEQALRAIDPAIKIVGSFPMQASFNATGINVNAPTLILTGEKDVVVWAIAQGYWTQYLLIKNAPAWMAVTKNSDHTTPTLELARNDYAGITVAFMLYRGKNDVAASKYFVGSPYRLSQDPQFIQAPKLLPALELRRVQRNKLADNLAPLSPAISITTKQ